MPGAYKDLSGRIFGKLEVLQVVMSSGGDGKVKRWICKCACGVVKEFSGHNLRSGTTKSCGCAKTSHGKYHSKTYKIWAAMKRRCTIPNSQNYENYGGRGITLCNEWYKFENFIADMGEKPEDLELDRIDNNKGYSKDNCRWATRKQQCQNTRKTCLLTIEEETFCISEWGRKFKIAPSTILKRLTKGWTVKEAITVPPNPKFITNKRGLCAH